MIEDNKYNEKYRSYKAPTLEICNELLKTEDIILIEIIKATDEDSLEESTNLLLSKKLNYFEMQNYVQMTGAIIVPLEEGVVIDEEFIQEYEESFAYIESYVLRQEDEDREEDDYSQLYLWEHAEGI